MLRDELGLPNLCGESIQRHAGFNRRLHDAHAELFMDGTEQLDHVHVETEFVEGNIFTKQWRYAWKSGAEVDEDLVGLHGRCIKDVADSLASQHSSIVIFW